MSRPLTVSFRERGHQPRLVVTGEIDLINATEFHDAVRGAITRCPRLIIDLTQVEFMGSVAVAPLYTYLDNLIAVLVTRNTAIARALSTAGFPMLITVPTTYETTLHRACGHADHQG
jgi:anti-anti-sigma factor